MKRIIVIPDNMTSEIEVNYLHPNAEDLTRGLCTFDEFVVVGYEKRGGMYIIPEDAKLILDNSNTSYL